MTAVALMSFESFLLYNYIRAFIISLLFSLSGPFVFPTSGIPCSPSISPIFFVASFIPKINPIVFKFFKDIPITKSIMPFRFVSFVLEMWSEHMAVARSYLDGINGIKWPPKTSNSRFFLISSLLKF